jgi:hypothetical protein
LHSQKNTRSYTNSNCIRKHRSWFTVMHISVTVSVLSFSLHGNHFTITSIFTTDNFWPFIFLILLSLVLRIYYYFWWLKVLLQL